MTGRAPKQGDDPLSRTYPARPNRRDGDGTCATGRVTRGGKQTVARTADDTPIYIGWPARLDGSLLRTTRIRALAAVSSMASSSLPVASSWVLFPSRQ